MRDTVEFSELSETQLAYIFPRLREYDRQELEIFGYTDENAWEQIQHCDQAICGILNNEPVCVFGYSLTPTTMRFGFFGTDKVERYWKRITKGAQSYLKYQMQQHPSHRPVIEVWEQHTQSRRWLKLLGFEESSTYRTTSKGRTIFLHFNKYNKARSDHKCATSQQPQQLSA